MTAPKDENLKANTTDDRDLLRLGYNPVLRRTMRNFASFALFFSVIGVDISIFSEFGYSLSESGPASALIFLLAGALQVVVALAIAELISAYPLAGGAYQITSQIRKGAVSWFVGWFVMIGLVASIATNSSTVPLYIGPAFGIKVPSYSQTLLIGLILIVAVTAINLLGTRFSAFVNNIGAICEMLGLSIVVILLLAKGVIHPISFLGSTERQGHPTEYFLPFLLGFILPVYMINAFDSSGHTGEETINASVVAPRATVLAAAASYVYGAIAMIVLVLSITKYSTIVGSSTPVTAIVDARLGNVVKDGFTVVVLVSFFVATQMLELTAARVIWAQARDRRFVADHFMTRLNRLRVPYVATLLVAVFAVILLLYSHGLAVLGAMVGLAFALAYGVALVYGVYGKRKRLVPAHPWHYGKMGWAITGIGIAASILGAVIMVLSGPGSVGKGMLAAFIIGLVFYAAMLVGAKRESASAVVDLVVSPDGSGEAATTGTSSASSEVSD